jgi:hypothetical protein
LQWLLGRRLQEEKRVAREGKSFSWEPVGFTIYDF